MLRLLRVQFIKANVACISIFYGTIALRKRKGKRGNSRDQEQVCGSRTLICGSGMRARNLCSKGAAALSGVVWALLIPGNKIRVKFLIQAEILGLSALRSVIGAAFIHTRNSHLFQSPHYNKFSLDQLRDSLQMLKETVSAFNGQNDIESILLLKSKGKIRLRAWLAKKLTLVYLT